MTRLNGSCCKILALQADFHLLTIVSIFMCGRVLALNPEINCGKLDRAAKCSKCVARFAGQFCSNCKLEFFFS